MIKSFGCLETARIFSRNYSSRFPFEIQKTALRKLRMLEAAPDLASLRVPPGNRLEALRGSREGKYSIRINGQWRICFAWKEGNAYDVEIVDYH